LPNKFSHHGSDEQMFGAAQQVLHGAKGEDVDMPMNGGATPGERRHFAVAPENFAAPNANCPLSSDLPIGGRPG
jgi:hypothetical protein